LTSDFKKKLFSNSHSHGESMLTDGRTAVKHMDSASIHWNT